MTSRASFAAYVELEDSAGQVIYAGEAIYRPARPHPVRGAPVPTVGIPDDSMPRRPDQTSGFAVRLSGERIPIETAYLERVSTCWWFVLSRVPAHPPTV
jgi:hypothetical protein